MEKQKRVQYIKFKQTTSRNLKCDCCGERMDGEEGYVKLHLIKSPRTSYQWNNDFFIKICWNCWQKINSEVNENRKSRKEDYDTLVKKQILLKL